MNILGKSSPVDHPEWKKYIIDFMPEKEFDTIAIAAYWLDEVEEKTAGHIILTLTVKSDKILIISVIRFQK